MTEQTRFGPAGVPPIFRALGAETSDVPKLLREEGLNAFEYEAVQWGQQPQIKEEHARKIGNETTKNDVRLSMHGSYFINLAGKKDVVEASKRRLMACAIAADWMGAYTLVFHTGFYGRFEKEFAFKNCLEAIKEVSAEIHDVGLKVKLGPETMGRTFQVGSLDEILTINEEVENTQLVIDWGHLHARGLGRLKKVEDFRVVAEKIEQRLGTQVLKSIHCHFSAIEFNSQGEKEHHTLDEKRYGPDFRLLAEVIADFQMHPTIICETPNLDVDARKMQATLKEVLENQAGKPKKTIV